MKPAMKHAALILAVALTSCGSPGRGGAEPPAVRPSDVTDFGILYRQNCSGCHGIDGQGALTLAISNPEYLAIAGSAAIRGVIEKGRPGTAMPAFAQNAGGMLTEAQVDIIVRGIGERWANPAALGSDKPPAYAASQPGDAARGHNVFAAYCSSCHGPEGRGGRAGSIVDSSYLALVSDQHLRTVAIIGIPALGAPDWRGNVPGKPMSDGDVTDVVAWLAAQRQPLSANLNPPGGLE
jgi:cytochrome c oxidase cbb3-type subunit 3